MGGQEVFPRDAESPDSARFCRSTEGRYRSLRDRGLVLRRQRRYWSGSTKPERCQEMKRRRKGRNPH